MPIVPIELPPGMMRNGTPYSARGRWADGNLIRWYAGAARPIGGWQQYQTAAPIAGLDPDEVIRDSISYRTNAGNRESLYFSNKRVYRLDSGNNVETVTPVGYPQTLSEPSTLTGYGIGPYGAGTYGTPRGGGNTIISEVGRVSADMWGENVLFAVNGIGPIYQLAPTDIVATPLANAPTDVDDLIVTDQRIVMVIKNKPEIRQIIWSDREDNTEWTPTVSNYAGSRVLHGHGKLIGLTKVLNQILVLSESDLHTGRYLGSPFVYGFETVGTKCRPLSDHAVVSTERFAIWPGTRNFWVFDGTLKSLPCEVMDFFRQNISISNSSKMFGMTISSYSEIWWFYQSLSSSEDVDSYVVFNYETPNWVTGKLARTSGFDREEYTNPIMVDKGGILFNHELEGVFVDGEAFLESGPLELERGNINTAVRYVFPDTQMKDDVTLSFKTRQMPTDVDTNYGPYTYENPISTTGVLGREVRMRLDMLTARAEVGAMRFDVQSVGGGFR